MTAPTREEIEAVARAIYENARGTYATKAIQWPYATYHVQQVIRGDARAAILALDEIRGKK